MFSSPLHGHTTSAAAGASLLPSAFGAGIVFLVPMAGTTDTRIEDWKTLVAIAEHLDVAAGFDIPYVFRGQEDADWTLAPSLHRAATNDKRVSLPSAEQLLRHEDAVTENFRAVAGIHLPPATFLTSLHPIDWWLLMRHYGVPSRVLDWTKSFYVAAYFAVAKAAEKDGMIYLVHVHTFNEAMKAAYGEGAAFATDPAAIDKAFRRAESPPALHLISRRNALVDRMIAQQGLSMISGNVAADPEAILAEQMPKAALLGRETYRKIRIPAAQKPTILKRLRTMNVTASSLFPGLDGIGRQLDEVMRNP